MGHGSSSSSSRTSVRMLRCDGDGDGDGDVDGKWQWQKVNKSLQIFAWVVHGARGRGQTEGGRDVGKLLSTTLKREPTLKLGLRQQSELEKDSGKQRVAKDEKARGECREGSEGRRLGSVEP